MAKKDTDFKKLAKEIVSISKQTGSKTEGYDTTAEVRRVEGDTAYVHITGGVDETPVKIDTNVREGDTVHVRISGGSAWAYGNSTNPPTDDRVANIAYNKAVYVEVAAGNAIDFVKELEDKDIKVNDIQANTGYIKELKADHITAEDISASSGYIKDLQSENITTENIVAASGYIETLKSQNITAQNIAADHATVGTLDANYAKIQDLNAAKGRIDDLEANEVVVNDTLKATNANVEYLKSDWISTDRLVLTGNNKNNYPPVQITETEFNVNKTAYWTKSGDDYTQCTTESVYDPDTQYYVRQNVQSIIEAINTANNTDPQVVVSNDKLIAASMDVAELSAITADMGTLTAGKIQKGNNFINLNTVPASMEFKNASTWANATQGIQFDTQGNLNIKGTVNITSGNVYTKTETDGKIDAIDVGGRNILLHTRGLSEWIVSSAASHGTDGEFGYIQLNGTDSNWDASVHSRETQSLELLDGRPMVLSFEYQANIDTGIGNIVFAGTSVQVGSTTADRTKFTGSGLGITLNATNKWTRVWFPITKSITVDAMTSGSGAVNSWYLQIYNRIPNSVLKIRKVKLEKGNKATDWTPAPEDMATTAELKVQADRIGMVVANQDASSSLQLTANAMDYIGDHVTIKGSDNSTTVISGGKIQTGSIKTNDLAANSITVGKMDSTTKSEVLNSEIEIGGQNVLHGSRYVNFANTQWRRFGWYKSGTGTVEVNVALSDSPIYGVSRGVKITTTAANSDIGIAQGLVPLKKGTITQSVWAKGTAGDTIKLQPFWSDTSSPMYEFVAKSFTIADGNWHRYEYTATVQYDHSAHTADSDTTQGGVNGGYVYYRSATVGRVAYICGNKIEYGNKATEWNDNPDDMPPNDTDNILIDTDVPFVGNPIYALDTNQSKYWSDSSNTMITPSIIAPPDTPTNDIRFAYRFVCNGTQTANKGRAVAFYSGVGNYIPLKTGQTYTATWWARCTAGSGDAYFAYTGNTSGGTSGSPHYDLTSAWKHCSYTFTPTVATASGAYTRIWFYAYFYANTSGTIDLCGFKLHSGMTDTDNFITMNDNDGIKVHAVNNPTSNYVQINSNGMYIYKGGVERAYFTADAVAIGTVNQGRSIIKNDGLHVYTYDGSQHDVALFGATARIGNANATHVTLVSDGLNCSTNSTTTPFSITWDVDSEAYKVGKMRAEQSSTIYSQILVRAKSGATELGLETYTSPKRASVKMTSNGTTAGVALAGTNITMNGDTFNSSCDNFAVTNTGNITASGSIKVSNHSTAIGSVLSANLTTAKTATRNAETNLLSLSLPAGTWVIESCVTFPTGTGGIVAMGVNTTSTGTAHQAQTAGNNYGATKLCAPYVVTQTSTTTYYLNAYNATSANLTIAAGSLHNGTYMYATRIA